MRWSGEVETGQWIRARLSPAWGTVGSVVPAGFDAYARILHPVPARLRGPVPEAAAPAHHAVLPPAGAPVIEETTWTWAQVAARTGALVHRRVQWRLLAGAADSTVRVDGGWELDPPDTGRLAPELLARLMVLARSATTTPDELLLGVWNGWGELHREPGAPTFLMVPTGTTPEEAEEIQAGFEAQEAAAVNPQVARALTEGPLLELPGRSYVLLQATAQELTDPAWPHRAGIGSIQGFHGPMPQLVWPADRAWCVATEIDWDSTIVGGSIELITAILQEGGLEAVTVEAADDLFWDGDDLNRPF